MNNSNDNTVADAKVYRYKLTVSGDGGEFSFIPMSHEQMLYWDEKGTAALTEHLTGGCEDDGTPPHLNLGFYYDYKDSTWGFGVDEDAELIVQTEDGTTCFQRSAYDLDDIIEIVRCVERSAPGAFFRTFEKGPATYEIETDEPFDPANLRLCITQTPEGNPIHGIMYAEEEACEEDELKPSSMKGEARLFG